MLDRVPTKPNRYAVYDDAHNFLRYEYHERADEPTQVGDALNKANLLPDTVATALGLTGNAQVKDALDKLKTLADIGISRAQIATGSYTGTGTSGASNPNSLTFDFDVKLFMVWYGLSDTEGGEVTNLYGSGITAIGLINASAIPKNDVYQSVKVPTMTTTNDRSLKVKKSTDGKTISWYSHAGGAEEQCNAIKNQVNKYYKYFYAAIG